MTCAICNRVIESDGDVPRRGVVTVLQSDGAGAVPATT